jgi:large subunit ribosomal protein L17
MRHRVKTTKLQRKTAHRRSLLANLACSLIEHGRIRTTLAKAKALRPVAEKMVTLGKRGDLHARRQALAFLRQKKAVGLLFDEVAPAAAKRHGGYCRITKLGPRPSDAAPMAFIEWVDRAVGTADDEELEAAVAGSKPERAAKAAAAAAVEEAGEEPAAEVDEVADDEPAAEAAEAGEVVEETDGEEPPKA